MKTALKIFSVFLLAAFLMTSIEGCSAKKKMLQEAKDIKVEAKKTRYKQKEVRKMGGPVCGIKELAIGESQRAFALYEIEAGDYPRVRHHLANADESIEIAYAKAKACEPPDQDRDGILDEDDECVTDPEDKDGFEDEDGCPDPDNDEDGFLDPDDKCPMDAEDKDDFEDEDGCPDLDNDEDGVPDLDDRCASDPEDKDEWQDEDGCPDPDNDEDGIFDDEDKCPNEAETFNGIDDEDGCPDESKYELIKVTDSAIEIKQKIYFATGKAVILSKSFPTLNEVALALKEHPNFKVKIGGHTDSRGNDKYNQKLSQKRAESVKKYLVKKSGIAEDRLQAIGFGETQPIDSNRTRAGRAKNRRVEFKIESK